MRRKKQLMSEERAERILDSGVTGVLAVSGDDGYPYTVPLNYVYENKAIYFHCAKSGHKLDAIRSNDKVSFCVVDKEDIVPEEFSTYFRSAVAFGRASELADDDEKTRIMRLFNNKYSPGLAEAGDTAIQKQLNVLCVIKMAVEHLTGKEAIELVKNRE